MPTQPPDHIEIIAHRGAPREHPENSLPGFERALKLGADGIELDVHLTVDGVAVVHHDPTVCRRADDPAADCPAIGRLTQRALRDYPLAPNVPIPTLAEVLELVGDRAVVYVELKGPGAEAEAVRCITGSAARCAVHAFDHRVPSRIAALAPHLPTGILVASYLLDPAGTLRAAGARDYWQQADLVDADLVGRIHDAGGRVIAWTVNDPMRARHLRMMGVDALCTDLCGALKAA